MAKIKSFDNSEFIRCLIAFTICTSSSYRITPKLHQSTDSVNGLKLYSSGAGIIPFLLAVYILFVSSVLHLYESNKSPSSSVSKLLMCKSLKSFKFKIVHFVANG